MEGKSCRLLMPITFYRMSSLLWSSIYMTWLHQQQPAAFLLFFNIEIMREHGALHSSNHDIVHAPNKQSPQHTVANHSVNKYANNARGSRL